MSKKKNTNSQKNIKQYIFVVAMIAILSSFLVGGYILSKAMKIERVEVISKDYQDAIKLNIGDSVNLGDYVETEMIEKMNFNNSGIFTIDDNYNISSLQEGSSELIIEYNNNKIDKFYLECEIPTSKATTSGTILTITLNNQSATTSGTQQIYEKYNYGAYLDSTASKKMSTSSNPIQIPKRTGYTFGGYYTKSSGEGVQVINQSGYVTSKFTKTYFQANSVVYAKWTANTKKILVTLDGDGANNESNPNTIYLNYGTGVYRDETVKQQMTTTQNPIIIPEKTGYVFGGYYLGKDGTGTQYINDRGYITSNFTITSFSQDTTIFAKWINNNIYTISLRNGDGATATISNIYEKYNDKLYSDKELTNVLAKINPPTKNGFTFEGYYTEANGNGTCLINKDGTINSNFASTLFTNDADIFAKWSVASGTILKISLNNQGANTQGTTVVYEKYGTGVYLDAATKNKMTTSTNKITIPTKKGYAFKGYYTSTSGKGKKLINENGFTTTNFTNSYFNSNQTIYAYWSDAYTDSINAERCYDDGNLKVVYKITTCQPTTIKDAKCNYTQKSGENMTGTILRSNLSTNLTGCDKTPYTETIEGERCDKTNQSIYYITKCQAKTATDPKCYYTKLDGKDSEGVIERSRLQYMINSCGSTKVTSPYNLKGVGANSNDNCMNTDTPGEGCLIADSKNESHMNHNTKLLQNLIDVSSANATKKKDGSISTINLPAGTYYFSVGEITSNGRAYVIEARDNVSIIGKGRNKGNASQNTMLKPYGLGTENYLKIGLDMFWYIHYSSETESKEFLKNITYKDFIINSDETRGWTYQVAGKGFFIQLCDNCHWDNVTVENTDGTGFGMDELKNSSITNCSAINCGKNAGRKNGSDITKITQAQRTAAAGGSGFGIGTGYDSEESIYINNCVSIGNAKFGYFFEHQNRFNTKLFNSTSSSGFIVENSKSEGNLYNFGGLRANDIYYNNNTSSNPIAYHVYFSDQSRNINISNMNISNQYTDVKTTDWYYEPVTWAAEKSISYGKMDSTTILTDTTGKNLQPYNQTDIKLFNPNDTINRAEAAMIIWRMYNRPGEVVTAKNANIGSVSDQIKIDVKAKTGFTDISNNAQYAQAVVWLKGTKATTGTSSTKYSPTSKLTKKQFIIMLYRLQNSPKVDGKSGDAYAEKWATNIGLTNSSSDNSSYIKRSEAITILYRYNNKYKVNDVKPSFAK